MASDAGRRNSPLSNNDEEGDCFRKEDGDLTLSLRNNHPKGTEFQVNKDEALAQPIEDDDDIISDPTTSFNTTTELTLGDARQDEGAVGFRTVQSQQQQQPVDESRKLFQRLWTDEDEIELLQGFLEYTNQRGASGQHHYDTTLFYDQIKSKLQLEFNKNQLVEKLRRLKKKYRNILNRITAGKEVAFKSAHDQATFEISRKIWANYSANIGASGGLDDEDANININLSPNPNYNFGTYSNNNSGNYSCNRTDLMADERKPVKSRKRLRMKVEDHRDSDERVLMPNSGAPRLGAISCVIEETVKSCVSPLFKDIMDTAVNGSCGARGFGIETMMSPLPLSFGNSGNMMGGGAMDEKWRRQQILELEVYSRRLELVQDEIKLQLQELRSAGS
uniref:Glabrous enhancer-binding protein-like DBD domain-containing protein n=1 Tax=Kalanchoe fedtschenkoi TaxID=63787 RepID=A0A7N0UQZ5_KALFE